MRIARGIAGIMIAAGLWSGLGTTHDNDIIVQSDGSAKIANDPSLRPGVCRVFDGNLTIYSCVPVYSPGGGTVERVYEDGSARYTDGWVIDAEIPEFYKP